MACGIDVIGKRVLATALPKEEEKKKVLLLPNEKRQEEILEVIGINEETPKNIKVGSRIFIKSNWVNKIKHKDQEICIISLEEIFGVINEKA